MYWMCPISKTNYQIVLRKGIWAFPKTAVKHMFSIKQGDLFFAYIKKERGAHDSEYGLGGVFRVSGEPYYSTDYLFKRGKRGGDIFPFRVTVRKIHSVDPPIPLVAVLRLFGDLKIQTKLPRTLWQPIFPISEDEAKILESILWRYG